MRAAILELHGRALWLTGQISHAHRCFDVALALLIDVDETSADRVRRLRATNPDGVLLDMLLSGLSSFIAAD